MSRFEPAGRSGTPSRARRWRAAAVLLAIAAGSGCMTMAPRSRPFGPSSIILSDVPILEFGPERCGAGSLSAVLTYYGETVSIESLDAELPKAPGGGVLSIDLLLAARRHGYDARWVEGDLAKLEAAVLDGMPVILMLRVLNAPGQGVDYYHYVVVDGVDPDRGLLRFQFGDGKARWSRLGRGLRRAWRGTGHAMLVVRPRGALDPATVVALRRAVDLEDSGRLREAADAYRDILRAHPDLARAWTNLGNVLADLGEPAEAEAAYRRALDLEPGDADASNNLAWLLYEQRRDLDEAERLARRAAYADSPDRDLALDTLGRILLALGRCGEASAVFRQALGLTPPSRPQAQAGVLEGLARSHLECGDASGARRLFERALAAKPDPETEEAIRARLATLEREAAD